MEFLEQLNRLIKIRNYMTEPRFSAVLIRLGIIGKRERKEYWDVWIKSIYHVSESPLFTPQVMSAILDSYKEIDILFKFTRLSREEDTLRKVYYTKGEHVFSEECNLDSRDGINLLNTIWETADSILNILHKVTSIESKGNGERKKSLNVYEYDFFYSHDTWKGGDAVYVATSNGFKELIYTPKYGYLTAKGEANYDTGTIEFAEDINTSGEDISEYKLTSSDYVYAGNLITDLNLLKNPKTENNGN